MIIGIMNYDSNYINSRASDKKNPERRKRSGCNYH